MMGNLICKRDAMLGMSALAQSAAEAVTATGVAHATGVVEAASVSAMGHEFDGEIFRRAESDPGSDPALLFTGEMSEEQVLARLRALQKQVRQAIAA